MIKYSDEFLISELQRFVKENGRNPTCRDVKIRNNYPGIHAYYNHFGSWNNALKAAGLKINMVHNNLTGKEVCAICKSKKDIPVWNYRNNKRLCEKCYHGDRKYLHGLLDPNSAIGLGIIIEYIVSKVLDDCEKCNTKDNFNSEYDLISKKYGTINVKSSKLYIVKNNSYWVFNRKNNLKIPDNYICVGLDETRCNILKVWIIPQTFKLNNKNAINIANSKTSRQNLQLCEVDSTPYNNVYQNLDVTTLTEFKNFNKIVSDFNANVVSTN